MRARALYSPPAGTLALWNVGRKKPLVTARSAHGVGAAVDEWSDVDVGGEGGGIARWVTSLGVLPCSDLVASGSSDGVVRLWEVRRRAPPRFLRSDATTSGAKTNLVRLSQADRGEARSPPALREVAEIALPGFVNGLAIARTGRFLLCATGQEHRLGRWERVRGARNAVFVVPVPSLEAACE